MFGGTLDVKKRGKKLLGHQLSLRLYSLKHAPMSRGALLELGRKVV
jgi:hypothetical protein